MSLSLVFRAFPISFLKTCGCVASWNVQQGIEQTCEIFVCYLSSLLTPVASTRRHVSLHGLNYRLFAEAYVRHITSCAELFCARLEPISVWKAKCLYKDEASLLGQ